MARTESYTVKVELDTTEFDKAMAGVKAEMDILASKIAQARGNTSKPTHNKCGITHELWCNDEKILVKEEPANVKAFRAITEGMLATYIEKNGDYGSSVEDLHADYGDVTLAVRLGDKYNRFKTLIKNKGKRLVKDETMLDTLLDLANYTVIAIMILKDNNHK